MDNFTVLIGIFPLHAILLSLFCDGVQHTTAPQILQSAVTLFPIRKREQSYQCKNLSDNLSDKILLDYVISTGYQTLRCVKFLCCW